MDTCSRKQLIATCSSDKTVNIWNYKDFKLELTQTYPEECLTVAFHPSGLHLVIALQDKVLMTNITSKGLNQIKSLSIKSCTEVKFSHGGHLFACVAKTNEIHVYNFYTADCPVSQQYPGHQGTVKCIEWFENDMGLSSCGLDGAIYFYDLFIH